MQIWLSTIGQRLDHADNTRTMLLASYLIQRGHQVTLWTSAWDHIRKIWRDEWREHAGGSWTMPNGLVVRFMKGCGYSRNIGPRRLADHMLAARDFRRQARSLPRPDIAIASLPDHITAAAMVAEGRAAGFPVMIDVRDKWPDIFFDYAPPAMKPLVKAGLLLESRRAATALADADALVAMMRSMLDWGLAKAGRPATADDRIFYLATMEPNLVDSAPLSDISDANRRALEAASGRTIFTFVGTFNRTQHPALILDAVDRMRADPGFDPSSTAVMIGGDGVDGDAVRARIAGHAFVHDLGWLKPPEMRAILARSDVGLLPMNFASEAFNNKAFAYLASGLPILNGALGDLADLIAAEGVGINLPAGNPDALAAAMRELAADRPRVAAMKTRARTLYGQSFDQATISQDYVRHIEAVASRRPQAG